MATTVLQIAFGKTPLVCRKAMRSVRSFADAHGYEYRLIRRRPTWARRWDCTAASNRLRLQEAISSVGAVWYFDWDCVVQTDIKAPRYLAFLPKRNHEAAFYAPRHDKGLLKTILDYLDAYSEAHKLPNGMPCESKERSRLCKIMKAYRSEMQYLNGADVRHLNIYTSRRR